MNWRQMTWDYPAGIGGILTILFSMSILGRGLFGVRPDYYLTAVALVGVGTGCALIAYHYLKSGEEDTATKKRILLIGMAVAAPLIALSILDMLNIL